MNLAQFLQDLWALILAALTLNTSALAAILAQPNAGWLALCVALLAGISKLAGDSVALFINRVTPRRFLLSLVAGGLMFALELALWAISIWIIAAIFFQTDQALRKTWLVVAVASAPWIFGVLVFIPYLGALLRWILRIWSWLLALVLLRDIFAFTLIAAFVTATVGWLVLRALGILFAHRVDAIQEWFWTRFTGTPTELTFTEQARELGKQLREGAQNQ
ncbi:MAG: hypothetical protein B6D41_16010 [Chloroflexi bacterium UTCFX4]|jgi:hypothetical protein|nr:MAG: hypothetical protein B6D41_16010 [Chloroflexi bacterium UTCFX4]